MHEACRIEFKLLKNVISGLMLAVQDVCVDRCRQTAAPQARILLIVTVFKLFIPLYCIASDLVRRFTTILNECTVSGIGRLLPCRLTPRISATDCLAYHRIKLSAFTWRGCLQVTNFLCSRAASAPVGRCTCQAMHAFLVVHVSVAHAGCASVCAGVVLVAICLPQLVAPADVVPLPAIAPYARLGPVRAWRVHIPLRERMCR